MSTGSGSVIQRGAPGHAGARAMGVFSEEVAEVVFKNYLSGNPGKWSRAVLEFLKTRPELASKAASIIAGEGLREVVFTVAQKMGINTDAELARTLLDAPDNILRGMAEAYVESAKNGGAHTAAPATTSTGTTPASNATVVVVTSYEVDLFVHRADPGNTERVLCRTFFEAKQNWLKKKHGGSTPQNDQQHGGRGKGRDNRPQHQQPAGKFPQDTLTLEQAKQTGLDECPICKPYTAAGIAAQEATMATASTTAAPAAEKSQPIPDWENDVGAIGRWLAIAFSASLTDTDFGDEMRTVPVKIWHDRAIFTAKQHNPNVVANMTATEVFDLNLPETLDEKETEAVVRLIFTAGQGNTNTGNKVKAVLDHLSGKKKKAEEKKKLDDAKAKVANASTISDKIEAERELLELLPKPSPWPRRLIIGGVITFALVVIITMIAIAEAMKY